MINSHLPPSTVHQLARQERPNDLDSSEQDRLLVGRQSNAGVGVLARLREDVAGIHQDSNAAAELPRQVDYQRHPEGFYCCFVGNCEGKWILNRLKRYRI